MKKAMFYISCRSVFFLRKENVTHGGDDDDELLKSEENGEDKPLVDSLNLDGEQD